MLASKYVTILAGQNYFDLSDRGDMSEEIAVNSVCEEVIRRMLGKSCSRLHWKVKDNIYSKNLVDGSADPMHQDADRRLAKQREDFETSLKKAEKARKDAGQGLRLELIEKAEASE